LGSNLDRQQQEKIDQIIISSEKAAELTKGLLAFSRKQQLATKTVNLNTIIRNLEKFLLRVIGEDVQLKSIVHELNLPVSIDTGQIEQALINLATNARDAMPHGGTLTIETGVQKLDAGFAHVRGYGTPGSYAVIAVSDTGAGMNEETQQKIFEPFFTTKETGKGTGLGLAIVYGIVKQHSGFIHLYSEPDKGTTFRIYLPLLDNDALAQKAPVSLPAPKGGNETILVAEDDPSVRALVAEILEEYGYQTILAGDGKDAVRQFAGNKDKIDLVLMDMIMPGQSGTAAADEIRRMQPDARILFTSGYTADFISSRGINDEAIELITKPVQPVELLRKVREMLDQ
jgi:polar amino acid transport system substrate-binding protein